MNVRLPLGTDTVPVDVPDNWINGRCYRPFEVSSASDPRAELLAAVNEPRGFDSLKAVVDGRKNAVIAVDTATPSVFAEVLPALIEELRDSSSLKPSDITILLTNSFWNPLSAKQAAELVPADLRSDYQVVVHDHTADSMCKDAGALSNGAPLLVNSAYTDADLKIVLGGVWPDILYGFTGGRCILLPGLAHEKTLQALYDFKAVDAPEATYGRIEGNPFSMAAFEALGKVGCDIAVSAMLSWQGGVSEVVLGHPAQSFMAAVQKLREKMTVEVKEPMDIVVTAGGGVPHDATLLKVLDALVAVLPILKPDGTIVLTADLSQGFGPGPMREMFLTAGGPRGFDETYGGGNGQFRPGQWIVQRYFRLLSKHEVIVYSKGMSEDELWAAGMTPTSDLQEAIHVAMQGHGQRCKICALPDGPFTLPKLKE